VEKFFFLSPSSSSSDTSIRAKSYSNWWTGEASDAISRSSSPPSRTVYVPLSRRSFADHYRRRQPDCRWSYVSNNIRARAYCGVRNENEITVARIRINVRRESKNHRPPPVKPRPGHGRVSRRARRARGANDGRETKYNKILVFDSRGWKCTEFPSPET